MFAVIEYDSGMGEYKLISVVDTAEEAVDWIAENRDDYMPLSVTRYAFGEVI